MEKLLEDWANIKNSSEYKEAIEQSKKRTERQTKQKAELQNLRMQINRLRQKGEDTEDLLLELRDKEKSYERGTCSSRWTGHSVPKTWRKNCV